MEKNPSEIWNEASRSKVKVRGHSIEDEGKKILKKYAMRQVVKGQG